MDRLGRTFAIIITYAVVLPFAAHAHGMPDRHEIGRIVAVDRGAVTLPNHRTVFLKHGTHIEPRGQRLERGQEIVVQGTDAANGNVNATAIRVLGKAYAIGPGYGNWYGGPMLRSTIDAKRFTQRAR